MQCEIEQREIAYALGGSYAQICLGLSGGFGPVYRDLFEGSLLTGTCEICVMADLLADAPSDDGTNTFGGQAPHTQVGAPEAVPCGRICGLRSVYLISTWYY